jgi:surface carbohydrate biosynthesis protein
MRRVVHIPIEKKHRELMSKLLVALELVARDIPVVIGYSRALFANTKNLPRGLMYLKGMNRVQNEVIKQLPGLGHLPVACDEEALGASGPMLVKDCWHEAQPLIGKVFCQGQEHRDALMRERGFTPDQLTITGNPRIDLLRPPFVDAWAKEANDIAQNHGPFILINTDMSGTNNKFHDLDYYRKVLIQVGWLDPDSPNDQVLLEDHLRHDRANMEAVDAFVLAMRDAMPGLKIVLRPHPSEDDRRWHALANNAANLTVVTDTETVPWLLAAKCLVQTGCTTGVEAAVLGIPSIGLTVGTEDNSFSGYRLSNRVNPLFTAIPRAIEAVREIVSKPNNPRALEEIRKIFAPYLDISHEQYAFEKTAIEIERLLPRAKFNVDTELKPIPENVDRYLKTTFDQAALTEGFSNLAEIQGRIDAMFGITPRATWSRPIVRDLDWGLYALLPRA